MAVLSDGKIWEMILKGKFKISPFVPEHIQPSSIDLTLNTHISKPKQDCVINPKENPNTCFEDLIIEGEYILSPNEMIIARIAEEITMPRDCNGHIFNRNSIVRIGVDVSLSGYINPGYSGQLPIVIKNFGASPVKLFPGMRICQLELNRTENEPQRDYSQRGDAKYFGEKDSLISSIHLDVEFTEAKGKTEKEISSFLIDRIKKKNTEFINSLTDKQKEELGIL